jgi:hypothetical protein
LLQAVRDKAQTKKKKPKADGDELLSDAESDDSDAAGGSLMHALLRLCLITSAWPQAWTWLAVAVSSAAEACFKICCGTLQSGITVPDNWLLFQSTNRPADDFLAGEEEGGDEGIGADPGACPCTTLSQVSCCGAKHVFRSPERQLSLSFAVPAATFHCLFKAASTVHRCCLASVSLTYVCGLRLCFCLFI